MAAPAAKAAGHRVEHLVPSSGRRLWLTVRPARRYRPANGAVFSFLWLVRSAYIGTDALATVLMQVPKLAVFGGMDILNRRVAANGLVITPFMFFGAFVGKKIVSRFSEFQFAILIDLTLVFAGLNFLLRG